NGSLAPSASTTVVINDVPAPTGNHLLSINVSLPNNNVEEAPLDNNGSLAFQYFPPVTAVSEGFENTGFITPGWDIFANNGIAWKRVTGVAKTGNASIMINNIGNRLIGQKSDLRLPGITLPNSLDTVVLSFQVAAATYTSVTTQQNNWDTLEVLVSTDCGASYLSLYKKWGSSLVTRQAATQAAFIPATSEWRKDSINLAAYIGMGNLLFAFRNTNGNENNIYLDDINLRTVTVNPNLKTKGFLVSPNPTSGSFTVQFFPQPSNLLALQVYTISGQKIIDLNTTGRASNNYLFNIGNQASGTYLVRAVFTDRVVVQKIVRY
ncbi:MAG: choice-of-anchor J domain-containing protein, partial [Chitinophagaceae bacterium]